MKKIIALALALLTVFFFTACDDSPNVDEDISDSGLTASDLPSETSDLSEESAPIESAIKERPTDENGKPLAYYLDENGERQYFELPKSLNLSKAENGDDYSCIVDFVREMNRFSRIERPSSENENGLDLSLNALFYAFDSVPRSSPEETQKWCDEYPATDSYVGFCAGYIKKSDFDGFVGEKFCDDLQGIVIDNLGYYYCEPIDRYAVPITGQYVSQLPVVLEEMTEENGKVRAKIIILYYVYYDEPEEGENEISTIGGQTVGKFEKGEALIDRALLEESQAYEYIFCRTDEGLKLHSIKAVK